MANLQEIIPAFFTGPNGQQLTPEQIAQRQQIAQSLLGRATDTRPDSGGWASVLTKGLLGYQSGAGQRAADAAIVKNAEQSQNDIAALLGGGAGYSVPVALGASPTSAVATGTPVSVPTGDMAGTIRQGLINRGLAPHLADAAILNFQDESGLNPGINEQNPIVAGSRGGYGLYQLTGPRRREYEAFAAQRGANPSDVDAQLDFFMGELAGSEAAAGKKFLSAPDTASAAQVLVNDFLRPAAEHRQSRSAKYGRVATTPQEAIAQVAPQGGEPSTSVFPNSQFNDRWNAGFLPDGSNLRPFRPGEQINNPDGSYSTELTTTWQLPDGQFVNVPSLWMGANGPVRFNPEDEQGIMGAMQQYEFGNAQAFPRYMSVQEAEAAARQRSNDGGAGSVNVQAPSSSVANALMPQQAAVTSESLLAQNDMMLGGALSTSGSSPVAQALSGYFPDAPGATPQGSNNQTATIARILGSPYASNEAKQLAMGMYQRQIDANDPMKQAQLQLTQAQTQAALRKANNPNADETYFGNPVAIQNQDGTISYGQIGNRGSFKPIQLGEGQTFAPPTKTIDTGTEVIMTDQAGNVISRTAKQNREAAAETAGGAVEGKTEAEKRLAAPGDIQAAQTALDVLNQIENHPGLSLGTGITSSANRIPGTSGYDFQNLVEQAKSGAFLSAIQQMRGMGALSNAEGAAATAAVNRMDTSTSKDAFLNAVLDYKKIVQNGLDRANKSAGNYQPSGKRTSTGVTWSVE